MKNLIDLSNKTYIVTGASSGIGRATAILLGQLDARVILIGRNEQKLNDTLLKMDGKDHQVLPFDLADFTKLNELIESVCLCTKEIDGIVHCAGIQSCEALRFIETDSMQETLQLNLMSPTLLTQEIRKKRIFNKNSSIVFLSSVAALMGSAGVSIYAASKAAITALTKSLAVELAADNIRVNCVAPAIVRTEMTEKMFLHRGKEKTGILEKKHLLGFGKPEDIANIIAFLLSDAAKWFTGSCIVADGGYSLDG